ncbi:MAG: hypothetical protein MRK00_07965 [Nitrosomonas sp.]|nr:hypothetical protein [Nitrosomonas sp.]
MPVPKKPVRLNTIGTSNKADNQDAAWAIVQTPLNATELKLFCQDIERMFRINPMLNFREWQQIGANRYYFRGQNISQQPPFEFELTFTTQQLAEGIQIDYAQGLKNRTTFMIESMSNPYDESFKNQSKLTITDFYNGIPEIERKQQLHRVDKSITVWANDIQRYLINWQKWSRFGLWRWYMRYLWQPMKPMGRRITAILFWVAFFELALIMLGAVVYFLEYTV